MVRSYNNKGPKIGANVFIAETADIIGNVTLEDNSNIWYSAVLRGDVSCIKVGENSNVQDGTVCHVDFTTPVIIGKNVTIGHNVTLHCCSIGDNCLIGMGAIVLDRAEIGECSMVGAGAVVTPNTKIPPKSLVLGSPAKVKRELTDDEIATIKENSRIYVELAKTYRHQAEERSEI